MGFITSPSLWHAARSGFGRGPSNDFLLHLINCVTKTPVCNNQPGAKGDRAVTSYWPAPHHITVHAPFFGLNKENTLQMLQSEIFALDPNPKNLVIKKSKNLGFGFPDGGQEQARRLPEDLHVRRQSRRPQVRDDPPRKCVLVITQTGQLYVY